MRNAYASQALQLISFPGEQASDADEMGSLDEAISFEDMELEIERTNIEVQRAIQSLVNRRKNLSNIETGVLQLVQSGNDHLTRFAQGRRSVLSLTPTPVEKQMLLEQKYGLSVMLKKQLTAAGITTVEQFEAANPAEIRSVVNLSALESLAELD